MTGADVWRKQIQATRSARQIELVRNFGDLTIHAEDMIALADQGKRAEAKELALAVFDGAAKVGLSQEAADLITGLGLGF